MHNSLTVYHGVRNGQEHGFRRRLTKLSRQGLSSLHRSATVYNQIKLRLKKNDRQCDRVGLLPCRFGLVRRRHHEGVAGGRRKNYYTTTAPSLGNSLRRHGWQQKIRPCVPEGLFFRTVRTFGIFSMGPANTAMMSERTLGDGRPMRSAPSRRDTYQPGVIPPTPTRPMTWKSPQTRPICRKQGKSNGAVSWLVPDHTTTY